MNKIVLTTATIPSVAFISGRKVFTLVPVGEYKIESINSGNKTVCLSSVNQSFADYNGKYYWVDKKVIEGVRR